MEWALYDAGAGHERRPVRRHAVGRIHPKRHDFQNHHGRRIYDALHVLSHVRLPSDGEYPKAALVQGGDGNFYGVTSSGGTAYGGGTFFTMTPSGALTTLYSFCVLNADWRTVTTPWR